MVVGAGGDDRAVVRPDGRGWIPTPAIFLVGAAAASDLVPSLGDLAIVSVEQIVTVALVLILFDGGMRIGLAQAAAGAVPVLSVGVLGTLLTAGAVAGLAHVVFGLPWRMALLVGTALAPDRSGGGVLGARQAGGRGGRAGAILEGESGANDPVGIALLLALLATGGVLDAGRRCGGRGEFALQMVGRARGRCRPVDARCWPRCAGCPAGRGAVSAAHAGAAR